MSKGTNKKKGDARKELDKQLPLITSRVTKSEVKKVSHYQWNWEIDNFSVRKSYKQRFSFENGKLVMLVEWVGFYRNKKIGSEPGFFFEKVDPSLVGKKFNFEITAENFPNVLLEFEEVPIIPNNLFLPPKHYFISKDDVKDNLGDDKKLKLNLMLTIDSGHARVNSSFMDVIEYDPTKGNPACDFSGDEEDYVDFAFQLDDSKFMTHRCLLAAYSDKFRKEFTDQKDGKEFSTFSNVSKEALGAFLRFLSTGEQDNVPKYLKEFVQLGQKFEVVDIKERLSEACFRYFEKDNKRALEVYKLAEENGLSEELKKVAFKAIQDRFLLFNQVIKPEAFGKLEPLIELCEALDEFEDIFEKNNCEPEINPIKDNNIIIKTAAI